MKHSLKILTGLAALLMAFSCSNALQPKEGKHYIQTEKGLLLPVPNAKNKENFDYDKVKVTFESDGVYMRTKELLGNVMMCLLFNTPQYKTILGNKEYRTNIVLEFKDFSDGWNVYCTPYSEFRHYTPFWTWDDVEAIRFLYEPESYDHKPLFPMDFESTEDYMEAVREAGFNYDVTIYGNSTSLPELNDPDFNDVFKLFKAHTNL